MGPEGQRHHLPGIRPTFRCRGQPKPAARGNLAVMEAMWRLVLSGKLMTQMEMKMTETRTCAHHWVIEPARGAISAGVCKLCGAAKAFANSDRALDGDAGAGRQPVGLAVLQRGRYTQRLRIRVSMAQRVSYRRSAEEAGVGLMAWCRRALEAAASRGLGPALEERPPTGGYTGEVEITLTRSQEDACHTSAHRSGQELGAWVRGILDSAA